MHLGPRNLSVRCTPFGKNAVPPPHPKCCSPRTIPVYHRTSHPWFSRKTIIFLAIGLKSLLKHMYLGNEEIQDFFFVTHQQTRDCAATNQNKTWWQRNLDLYILFSNKTRLHQPKTKSTREYLSSPPPSGAERNYVSSTLTGSSTLTNALWSDQKKFEFPSLADRQKEKSNFLLMQGYGRRWYIFFLKNLLH